jgi:hypothetical protein
MEAGARRVALVRRARELRAQGMSWAATAAAMDLPMGSIFKLCERAAHLSDPTACDMATRSSRTAARREAHATALSANQVAAVRRWLLLSNRDWKSGSMAEAVRQAIRAGDLPADLGERMLAREADGLPILTQAQRNQLRIGEATTRSFRNGREAWLDYIESPGSLMLWTDPETGEERPIEPGEVWTLDDGTINLVCCVPTDDPQWPHKVMPGRFQFLLLVDHRSQFIPGFSYTARPRDSYRAEDLVATIDIAAREHGLPRRMVLEKGVSASTALTRCLGLAGVQIIRANSPHEKVVEGVFNQLWTRLSFLPGQVGRYRGEEERVTALLQSCRAGATDPRRHFMMLADVLREIRGVIAEHNDHWINGSRYGRWQPGEFFAREAGKHLRRVAAEDRWLFAPFVSDPLKVRKLLLQTTVPLAEGFSERFSFAATWLVDWLGASVRLHWNPFAADEYATATLAGAFGGHRDGAVLGRLEMTDRHARWTRRAWGYSDAADAGTGPVRRAAQALHRSAEAIRPDGKPGVREATVRSGTGEGATISTGEQNDGDAVERIPTRAIPAPRRALDNAPRRDLSQFDPGDLLGSDNKTETLQRCRVEEFDAAALL